MPLNNPGGVRMSTAITYLDACRHRLNLTVRSNVVARRIVFDGKHATGVEVESQGEIFVLDGEEIILSAGAIASPQLLLLSGVGDAEQLRPLGIQPVHDLPGVGRSMKNHPSVSIVFRSQPDHHLAPDAPRNQVGLRFTAEGSSDRNDIQVQPTTSYPGEPGGAQHPCGVSAGIPVQRGPADPGIIGRIGAAGSGFPVPDGSPGYGPVPRRGAPHGANLRAPGFRRSIGGASVTD